MKPIRFLFLGLITCFGSGVAVASTINVGDRLWTPAQNGNALRSALPTAQGGDTLLLAAGATFEGPFVLSSTALSYITIRTSTPDCPVTSGPCLPMDRRVSPADVAMLAKITTPVTANANNSAITTGKTAGVGYYRLIGVEIATSYYVYNLVSLGTASESNWNGTWGTSTAPLFQITNAADRLTITHNTAFNSKAITYSFDKPNTNFAFIANVVDHNVCGGDNHICGMSGDSVATGINALNKYFVNYDVRYNEMYRNVENDPYPMPNDFADPSLVHFDSNYVMTSPSYSDAQGRQAGVDASVMAKTAAVVQVCTSSGVDCGSQP